MQLIIDIKNKSLVDKIIWFLESFKGRGVEIIQKNPSIEKIEEYSDAYIKENWRELVMTSNSDPEYYKSEQYYEDRGNYLMEKYQ